MSDESPRKLSLFDAVGMAVGGMVGGGIFAVLGQAATASGNGAFLAFGIAGVLALTTGVSYARLTSDFDEPGGSFSYVEELAGPGVAGTVGWFLLVGYLFTNSLYAYTFGAYAGRLLGRGGQWTPFLGSAVVLALTTLNVVGVRASAVAEDVVVYSKVGLLILLGAVGLAAVGPEQALPLIEGSPVGLISGAALIFVGYEGFQLLTYDYDVLEDHRRNLSRAIWIAIPFVTVLYMFIAFVLTGTVDAETIRAREETVLAEVARPMLGRTGLVLVLVAAVLSTASAINATLFATGRLAGRISRDGELPALLTRWTTNGVPVVFLGVQAVLAIALLFTVRLEEIVTFSSLVFLLVFALVNAAAFLHRVFTGWRRGLPVLGFIGCLGAAGVLAVRTAREDMGTLLVIAGISASLLLLRLIRRIARRERED